MEDNCKIVQDLLPTYIEKMTSDETSLFIKEHLENCAECQKIYNSMISELEKEKIEDTETIKEIKKYRRKITIIKTIIFLIVVGIIAFTIINISYKFWIVKNAYIRNTNYEAYGNFTLEEYENSIESARKHYKTYYKGNEMKKLYGDDVIEYYDGENHYYFDNDNKTYWVDENVEINHALNIDISILDEMKNIVKDGKISNIEILKFILFSKDIIIGKEGFRTKEYYIIKNYDEQKVYLDKDTFYAERITKDNKDSEKKEYRVITSNVSWQEVFKPDLSQYTLVQK